MVTAIGSMFWLLSVPAESAPKSMCRYSILPVTLPTMRASMPPPTVQPSLAVRVANGIGAAWGLPLLSRLNPELSAECAIPPTARPPVT